MAAFLQFSHDYRVQDLLTPNMGGVSDVCHIDTFWVGPELQRNIWQTF